MNTAASDSVIDRIVKPISREPSSAACSGGFAHLHVAHDVLQHHDRVVDDEADRQRQRHQRQVVEAVAEQRTSPANVPMIEIGSASAGMIVADDVAQEQEDHDDDQHAA